jgi:hypothetical protein
MSVPYSENAVAPITDLQEPVRKQVIGVMVRVSVPEDVVPEDVVRDLRHSIEFGQAEISLAYVLAPPVIESPPDTP